MPVSTFTESVFRWVFDNIEPAITQLIRENSAVADQAVLDAVAGVQTHITTIEAALTAAEGRDATTKQMIADLTAKVQAGADQSQVVAGLADIGAHLDADTARVNALDGGAAPAPPVVTGP